MNTSTRFAVAVHALAVLASDAGPHHASDAIAQSVTTNAVVIRRILGTLRDAGLVSAQLGSGGGWKLEHAPTAITLGSVYRCVEDGPLLRLPLREPDAECPIGGGVRAALSEVIASAEQSMLHALDGITLADVLQRGQTLNPLGRSSVAG